MKKSREKIAFARKLRREQTDAERMLWSRLRNRWLDGVKFRRQQPIGPYVVDFVSFSRKLVIELDGSQHAETEPKKRDDARTRWLTERGYRVLRFWNNEVLVSTDSVLEMIREALQ